MEQYTFFGAPIPYPTESFSSWFHRFCLQQGMGFKQALDYFKIPLGRDLDYEIDHVTLHEIATACAVAHDQYLLWRSTSNTIQRHRAVRKKLRQTPRGEATTAFCTDCLKSEDQPYLRLEWRFDFWRICPKHRQKLDHVCRNCKNQIILDKSILTASVPAPNLNFCKYCLSPFNGRIRTSITPLSDEEIDKGLAIQRALMATIIHGYGHIAPLKARVTPGVLIRLLDANLLSTAVEGDFEEEVPQERAKYLKKMLRRFKTVALRIERRKNWSQIKERAIERQIQHRRRKIRRPRRTGV